MNIDPPPTRTTANIPGRFNPIVDLGPPGSGPDLHLALGAMPTQVQDVLKLIDHAPTAEHPATRECNPRVLQRLGMSALWSAPLDARHHLEAAYALYGQGRADPQQRLSCISGILSSYFYLRDDFSGADRWFDAAEEILDLQPDGMARTALDIDMCCALLQVLIWRNPKHPRAQACLSQAKQLLLADLPEEARLRLASSAILFCFWSGDVMTAQLIMGLADELTGSANLSPSARIMHGLMSSLFAGMTGDSPTCRAAVDSSYALAQAHDIHCFDFQLLAQKTLAALTENDVHGAKTHLRGIAPLVKPGVHGDASLYHYLYGWCCASDGDWPQALSHLEYAVAETRIAGMRPPQLASLTSLAQAYGHLGRFDDAKDALEKASALASHLDSDHLRYALLLVRAEHDLLRGDIPRIDDSLRQAFEIGRRRGYRRGLGWVPRSMACLCQHALHAGIEVEHVRQLIRECAVQPPDLSSAPGNWPFPIEIQAFGPLTIWRDGQPMGSSRKAQKKLTQLVAALIAFGGREVSTDQLAAALWPDADGDLAQNNLKSTLFRLRQWIGPQALVLCESRLSLSTAHCRIDTWHFEQLLAQLESRIKSTADTCALFDVLDRLFELYRAPLLDGEEDCHVITQRERLRNKFVRILGFAIAHLQQLGQHEKVIEFSERALEIEPLVESFHMAILRACLALQRPSQGLVAYARCSSVLQAELGVLPCEEARRTGEQLREL